MLPDQVHNRSHQFNLQWSWPPSSSTCSSNKCITWLWWFRRCNTWPCLNSRCITWIQLWLVHHKATNLPIVVLGNMGCHNQWRSPRHGHDRHSPSPCSDKDSTPKHSSSQLRVQTTRATYELLKRNLSSSSTKASWTWVRSVHPWSSG